MKIIGMLPVYNDEDMVGEVIEHLLSQGLELVVLDNGSTDNSYEICKKFAEKGLITLDQKKTSKFDFPLILRILYDMALTRNPDWLIRSDQDEILESGTENLTLKEAIKQEDEKGHNLIQFDVFEFFTTNNDNHFAKSVKDEFRYYSWQHDYAYRSWKHIPGVRVENEAGHMPIFPEGCPYRISEKKFVLRHYRFRNKEQAIRNNKQRLLRTNNTPEKNIGWYTHFDKISKKQFEPVDFNLLNKYNEDNNWNLEKKFQPYVITSHKTRNEIFSEDGKLRIHRLTIPETWAALQSQRKKIILLTEQLDKLSSKSHFTNHKKIPTVSNSIILDSKPFLLITGMHRSGTSFLARSLNLAGVYLGNLESIVSHDWLAHKDNLRGHWENTKILTLLRRTLEINHGSWKDIPSNITIPQDLRKEIIGIIKGLTEYPSLMSGFKDPSILLCLDSWKDYLPKNIILVGIFRNPKFVAESLKKRNGLSYEYSLHLWKHYNHKLLEYLEQYDGFLINFDWPKEKLLSEIYKIIKKLSLINTINLSDWYSENLITGDKNPDQNLVIPDEIKKIHSDLLKRSELNDNVTIKTYPYSIEDYRAIVVGLCSDLQNQGNYFKKIYDKYLEMLKGVESENKFELPKNNKTLN